MKISNINMNGLYYHEPSHKYSRHDDLYWCQNWTFKPCEYNRKIYMRDTYWSGGNGMVIEVDENNVDEFKLIFDWREVEQVNNYENLEEFGEKGKDWFIVCVDSGGMGYPKSFIRKGAKRNKDMVLKRKREEIKTLQRKIGDIEFYINRIESGEIEPRDWE